MALAGFKERDFSRFDEGNRLTTGTLPMGRSVDHHRRDPGNRIPREIGLEKEEMNIGGWIFLVLGWGLVTALLSLCYYRILKKKS